MTNRTDQQKQIDAFNRMLELKGLREIKGEEDNPKIVQFFEESGHAWVKDDETAWCAAAVGAVLKRAGLVGTGKLNARSYLDWGEKVPLAEARKGDIVVYWRGDPKGWQGHVGFYVSHGDGAIMTLGGNQGDAISIAPYKLSRLLSVRRMPAPKPAGPTIRPRPIPALPHWVLRLLGRA